MPLTGVRQELTNLNRQLAEPTAALRVASEPVTRLRGFVNRVSEVEALVHSERSAYDDDLSAWILAKCRGDRPVSPQALLDLERRLGEAQTGCSCSAAGNARHEATAAAAAAERPSPSSSRRWAAGLRL
jgi:hypothetical protein